MLKSSTVSRIYLFIGLQKCGLNFINQTNFSLQYNLAAFCWSVWRVCVTQHLRIIAPAGHTGPFKEMSCNGEPLATLPVRPIWPIRNLKIWCSRDERVTARPIGLLVLNYSLIKIKFDFTEKNFEAAVSYLNAAYWSWKIKPYTATK